MGCGKTVRSFTCKACGIRFSKAASTSGIYGTGTDSGSSISCPSDVDSALEWTYRPPKAKWCYEGGHTLQPFIESSLSSSSSSSALNQKKPDPRRICHDIVSLRASSKLQEQINAIPTQHPNVRILTIQSAGICYDDSLKITLHNLVMPKLEQLLLLDVSFQKITLNQHLTPVLRTLEMQNVPDDCEISIQCPTLQEVNIRFNCPDKNDWVNDMLSHATKLRFFQSYKLWIDSISFASNDLEEIHLHRSDSLYRIQLWAPRLQYLRLQGCYSLEELDVLEEHPVLSKELPEGYEMSEFEVETTNSCVGSVIEEVLTTHPRIYWEAEDICEY